MIDPQIQFQDVDCPKIRLMVKGLIEDLEQLCPSDSVVRASIHKVQDRFFATVNVASEQVCMQVAEQANALSDLLDHVRVRMLTQIVDWRNHRFAV